MRKIMMMMPASADGFFEGLERDLNWHKVDRESDRDRCVGLWSGRCGTEDSRLVLRGAGVLEAGYISRRQAQRRGPAVPTPQRAARP